MARQPRLVIPAQAHMIAQSAVDKQIVFRDADDHRCFLNWLRDAAKLYKVAIHAYVLMPDHVQVLATPVDPEGLARMMQWVGRHYVPYFNKKYQRAGTLWQGRFKASVVDAACVLLCSRYIEIAPVRALLANNASEFPWSSHLHHIGLNLDPLIVEHAAYWALGNTPFERDAAFKGLTEQGLTNAEMQMIDNGLAKGHVIGSEAFKTELEKLTSRKVRPGKRGRPSKPVAVEGDSGKGAPGQ